MGAERQAGAGRHPRLPRPGAGQGGALRHLRRRREHWLGQRRHRPCTAAFAVESIRCWWNGAGRTTYPTAGRLLNTADACGSSGYRTRTWKTELARFAAEAGLTITVCHLPPGTSKWNRIEHRLFSHITMNCRGRPLASHEVIVESIASTTTKAGLTVHAELDTNPHPTGIQVSDDEIASLPITATASTATGTTPSTPSIRWTRPRPTARRTGPRRADRLASRGVRCRTRN